MATIAREMNNKFWAALAIGYQVIIGYSLAFVFYQLGSYLFYGAAFGLGQIIAILLLLFAAFMVARPKAKAKTVIEGVTA